jgi:hypothetical protein
MRKRSTATARRAAVEVIQPPVPTAAECGVCFWCSHQFEPCDLPKDAGKDWYGCRKVEYDGRQGTVTERSRWGSFVTKTATVHDHDRLDVPFLPGVYVCRGCLAQSRDTQNKSFPGGPAHPNAVKWTKFFASLVASQNRLDAAVPKSLFNPKTYNHPGWRKWDAAVKSGKIKLDLRCRFELLPGNGKLGRGIGKIGAVEVVTMDEGQAAAFKERLAEQERRDNAYRARRAAEEAEKAKASQRAAMAASVTIGEAA